MQRLAESADLTETKNNHVGEIYWDTISGILFMIRHTLSISANQNEYKQIGWLGKTFDMYDSQQSRIVRITHYRISLAELCINSTQTLFWLWEHSFTP